MKEYYVYIMTNNSGTLYTGMTNDIERRVHEHKTKFNRGFTSKYRISRLVSYEDYTSVWEAIEREKQIKSWRRSKKLELIRSTNPHWEDLAEDWYGDLKPAPSP